MSDKSVVNNVVELLFSDNGKFQGNYSLDGFEKHIHQQNPRITMVACCDSRVHTESIHGSPINDAFIIRNIGNQMVTALGSVDYGVNTLKTPLLIIKGHSRCGAVHGACTIDDIDSSTPVGKELSTLDVKSKNDLNKAILENIHNQVDFAKQRYSDKLQNNDIAIIGILYDFANDYSNGHGSLTLVNYNGDTNPEMLKETFGNLPNLKTL